MAMMTMTEGNETPTNVAAVSATKENVRPNSGRKKWRKKLDQKHRRAAAGDEGTTAAAGAIEGNHDGNQPKNSVEKKIKNGKKLNLKNKKAVVVEISSQKTPGRSPILPSMDYNAAEASAPSSSSSPYSNEASPSGRVKKTRPNKNKKYPSRHRPKAKKGEANHMNTDDFSTNAGGASVLALLGQYPYLGPSVEGSHYPYAGPSVEGSHYPYAGPSVDGHSSPGPQVMMSGDNYHAQYDPSSLPSTGISSGGAIPSTYAGHAYHGMQYSYPAPDMHPGATVMMAANYYVPVMTHYNGAVYYNQQTGAAEYPAYYAGYAPYGTTEPSAHHHESTSGKTLNIDAPAFNPKETHDE